MRLAPLVAAVWVIVFFGACGRGTTSSQDGAPPSLWSRVTRGAGEVTRHRNHSSYVGESQLRDYPEGSYQDWYRQRHLLERTRREDNRARNRAQAKAEYQARYQDDQEEW